MTRATAAFGLVMIGLTAAFASLFLAAKQNWGDAYLLMSAAYSMRCAAGIIDV